MDLELALKIMALIALISITILAVFAMVSLSNFSSFLKETSKELTDFKKTVNKSLTEFRTDFEELKQRLQVSMTHFNESAGEMKLTSQKFRGTSEKLNEKIDRIDGIIKPVESLVQEVHGKVAPPARNLANFVGAVSKSVTVFADVLTKKK